MLTPYGYRPEKYIRIRMVSGFSWDVQWSQEKIKTILVQNFGGQTKSTMVFSKVAYTNSSSANKYSLTFDTDLYCGQFIIFISQVR